jgi:hypothetical protein
LLLVPKGDADVIAFNGFGRAPQAVEMDWYLDRRVRCPSTSSLAQYLW